MITSNDLFYLYLLNKYWDLGFGQWKNWTKYICPMAVKNSNGQMDKLYNLSIWPQFGIWPEFGFGHNWSGQIRPKWSNK